MDNNEISSVDENIEPSLILKGGHWTQPPSTSSETDALTNDTHM